MEALFFKKMKKLVLVCALFFLYFYTGAQYFETGQDPASLNWRQINTENFQLIYPDYYEEQAQLLAQKLEKVYVYASYSLHHQPGPISILLHTQTVQSNGLVAYAPKRSEFYTTPNQSIYPLDWLEQLAVHEFRHVVQIDKVNSEMPKIIKILLGEQGTALVFGAYLPWWFIEGDAVVTETALSKFGRGRLPSFLMEHRAQVVDKGKYSYDKAYLGSYKDYVPDHYQLGYYLVANSRQRYGSALWDNVLTRVGAKPFSLTPFNTALKRQTGFNKVQLYNSVFDSLAGVWDMKYSSLRSSSGLTAQSKTYTSYTFNHWLNEQELVSYRTSMNRIPAFVRIDGEGKETVIHHPGIIFNESIDFRGEWIVWSEQVPDLRWSHSGRSLIRLLNIYSGKKLELKTEFKAFSPSLSPDHNKIAVVEADFSSNYFLAVYDVVTGVVLKRIQTPANNYFFSPQWIDDQNLLAIILTKNGKRLAKFDLVSGKHELLTDNDLGNIKQPKINENRVYFIGSYTGKDALYVINLESKKISQLYEPRFGAAYPAVSGEGKIVLSDYTSDGYRLITPQSSAKKLEELTPEPYELAETMARQEMGLPDLSVSDSVKYTSKHYSKARYLLNFHSWAPIFVDPYQYEFFPGISLMSQNVLGTAETVLGYRWYTSEKTGQFYARYIYKGWFPVFDFEISHGKRASQYTLITENTQNGQVISRDTTRERFTWQETRFNATSRLPLNLTKGKFYRLLQPQISYELTRRKENKDAPDGFHDGNYQSVSYRLYFHQLLRRSYQDVLPDFGFVLDGSFYHSPFGAKNLGTMLGGQSILYAPGVLRNHGVKLYGGTQSRTNGDHYSFSDIIRFPRGWIRTGTKELSVLSFDYEMPLINPDLSIGSLVYVRRINTTLFYDHGFLTRYNYEDGKPVSTFNQQISSYGVEIIGNVNFLRFYAPVQIGFRTSYLNEINDFSFDFLLSIDFNTL